MRTIGMCVLLSLAVLWGVEAGAQARWPESFAALQGQTQGTQDAAVIVGVEDYVFVADVPGAVANANDWYTYLRRERGVPRTHIALLRDTQATREGIGDAIQNAIAQVGPGGTLWFVFIGHGAPAADGNDGVLIGVDAQQNPRSLYARSLARTDILTQLATGPQTQTVVLLDACFSGRGPYGAALVPGLQPLLPVAQQIQAPEGTVVLAAGGSDQFAGPLPRLGRPAFSYLMLGALRGWADEDNNGAVTVQEALGYTGDTLKVMILDRSQDPEQLAGKGTQVLAAGTMEAGPELDAIRLAPISPEPDTPSGGTVTQPFSPSQQQDVGLFRFSFGPAILGKEVFSGGELTLQTAELNNQSAVVTAQVGDMSDTVSAYAATLWFVVGNNGFGFSTGLDFMFSTDLDATVRITSNDTLDADEAELEMAARTGRDYELGGMFMSGLLLEPHYRVTFGDVALTAQTGVGFYLGAYTILDDGADDPTTIDFIDFNESVFNFWFSWPIRAIVDYEVGDGIGVGVMYSYYIYPSTLQQIQASAAFGF